ncbi:CKLF-like MARVEL transmembrane domain-containing protein 7 [Trichogramma pretiosum]|uniref:CKLF-like MARVEL transmembrane domain-containing protein 7 n=1 Tax=Trichogramma pretiosum TaxID=7493 RepID=UPI0006C940D6|nr:CKLF-like MARVEL transmembrane domain-containing protein 7 [Trichogramma pretiosum]XP_014222256.1 CKLF-like MARVEL transmembrane domain-containing protein 7 [Trichogramma pretiosum]XP_014222257.1 CKLF-like MARVEL transmembrane domain-containing protein 7 [Trichogramma pretiosum]
MQAFPGQVNTATTATAQTSGSVPLRLDLSYIKTVHGMLKCAQIVLNLLGFICIMCSHLSTNSRCEWFNMVSMIGFWTSGILLGFYLFHVIEKFHKIPWFKIEFYFCAVETACYLLASALVAALAGASESLGVAGFFGFCAMCAYGFDTWMKFKALKSGEYPQGQPPSSKPVSTVGSPAGY